VSLDAASLDGSGVPQSPLADPTRQRDWMDRIVQGRQRKSHGKAESGDRLQRADSSQHGVRVQGEDAEDRDRPHRADGSLHDSSKAAAGESDRHTLCFNVRP
jgi:hypothetical protein